SDVIAAILTRDPDHAVLPLSTPPPLRTLLARCLERDPRRRLRDMGEARIALETPDAALPLGLPPVAESAARGKTASWRALLLAWALVAPLGAVAAVLFWQGRRPTAPPATSVVRFTIAVPSEKTIGFEQLGDIPAVALSPDGSRLVY